MALHRNWTISATLDRPLTQDVVFIRCFQVESLPRNRGKSGHALKGFSPAQSRYGHSPNARLAEYASFVLRPRVRGVRWENMLN